VPPRHRGPARAEGEVRAFRPGCYRSARICPKGIGRPATRASRLEVLAPPPGRVYICDMTTPTQRPEFEPDQIAQAVSVGLCFALAAVLLVLVLV
jgi:hypothetical protein